MHPHYVHNVQADAGADPGYTTTPWHQVEGLSAIDRIHATVVDWHDTDADEEKHHCHGNAICHVGPGGLGITQHLKEPAETKHIFSENNNSIQFNFKKTVSTLPH